MPGLFFHPLNRRDFLKISARTGAGAALLHTLTPALAAPNDSAQPVHLALISDTHVAADPKNEYRKFLPAENLARVAQEIMAARPEAVLLDGDAARLSGELADYEALKGILAPVAQQCPVYIGLGNHDHRQNFHKIFPPPQPQAQNVTDKHVLVLERPFLRVLILDSLLYVNQVAGLLGKKQRQWLDGYLASTDSRPTVLFVHHTLGDEDGELLDVEALFRLVRPYTKVKAIFFGHSHQYTYSQRHGIHLVNLPAVGYNFNDREPVGWVDSFFSPAGVELTLKAFGGNREQDGRSTSLAWRSV